MLKAMICFIAETDNTFLSLPSFCMSNAQFALNLMKLLLKWHFDKTPEKAQRVIIIKTASDLKYFVSQIY